jgi:hypothetical protein
MSFLLRQVAHCDVCGHEWLTSKVPSHCAKCKSRKWNQGVVSSVQPADGSKVFIDQPRKVVHGALPELEQLPILAGYRKRTEHAKTCKCLMCKPPKSSQSSPRS